MNEITVARTDPTYNAHGYLTKVPEGAIRPFIEKHTGPGETVLDPFAGSGMTGVAAYILGRNAELSDISVLGRHIGTNLLNIVDPASYRAAALTAVETALKEIGRHYEAECSACGKRSAFSKLVWSYVYSCPSCSSKLVYYDLLRGNRWRLPTRCPGCGNGFQRRTASRVDEIPVLLSLNCGRCGNKEERSLSQDDLGRIASARRARRKWTVPDLPIAPEREMFRRSALGKSGLTSTSTFFSDRNAMALSALRRAIDGVPDTSLRSKLLFAFTAILPRASKRYQWHPKRPLNAQNQTYYVAPVFYEWNVFELFARKVEAAIRSDRYIQEKAGSGTLFHRSAQARYVVSSADCLAHLKDESVDYVFTDPPFGSNLFYSDMGLFQEAWLGETTDPAREAVIHTDRGRRGASAAAYERILTDALRECRRVLKPGRCLSIVFSNSRGEVWAVLQRAIVASGLAVDPEATASLDKGQRSVKGLNSGSEGVVTADLVLTLRNAAGALGIQPRPIDRPAREIISDLLRAAPTRRFLTPTQAYLYVIRSVVEKHLTLEPFNFAEVLAALNSLGYSVDRGSGRLKARTASLA